MSPTGDANFFLGLAEHNLSRGDLKAALTCLESAQARRGPAWDEARAQALLDELTRAGAPTSELARLRASCATAGPPAPPSNQPPADPSPSERRTLEAVRRLLVSPEVLGHLKTLVGPEDSQPQGPLALPVLEVMRRLLGADLDLQATARLALELLVEATGADDGFLVLPDPGRTSFGLHGAGRPPLASAGVLERVQRTRQAVLSADALNDPLLCDRESVRKLGLRSILCVPMLVGEAEEFAGAIYLTATRDARFGAAASELAQALAALVAQPLQNARRYSEQSHSLVTVSREQPSASPATPLGESPPFLALIERAEAFAAAEQPVLILGESGSGKELIARLIHSRGARAQGPFVAENVGALAEGLVEAALFGHTRGAFTGAVRDAPGLFRLAEGGVLLLDELAEMPLSTQAKLLRVLQEGEVRPVGASSTQRVNVRVVAATHADLLQRVEEGRFREDLYYRLRVLELTVPPLRARGDDALVLLRHFLGREAAQHGLAPPALDAQLSARVRAHSWPGNVRELQAFAARLVLSGPQAAFVASPQGVSIEGSGAPGELRVDVSLPSAPPELRTARKAFERAYISAALERSAGSVQEAAKLLGLNRSYLSELITRHDLR